MPERNRGPSRDGPRFLYLNLSGMDWLAGRRSGDVTRWGVPEHSRMPPHIPPRQWSWMRSRDILCISQPDPMTIATILKWGNSHGLRLSKAVLAEAGLVAGDALDVTVRDGEIVLTPARRVRGGHDLRDLVRRLPKGSASTELDWGSAVGREEW